jgi:hypothetical protein
MKWPVPITLFTRMLGCSDAAILEGLIRKS